RMQASWQSEARDTEASSLAASAALSGTGAAMGASASSAAPAPAASAAPSAAAPASALSRVPDVDLDADGTFKYVMLTLSDPATGESNYKFAEYHVDVADHTRAELDEDKATAGLKLSVSGGGRIRREAASKRLVVYGYSMQFGRADHDAAAKLIRKAIPDYAPDAITWNNEGY
ncbi:PHPT1, partial [Symbiodinium sp. KB8]